LAGFAAGPSKIGLVKDTLEHYIDVSDTELDFEHEMKQGERLVQDAIGASTSHAFTPETYDSAATTTATASEGATSSPPPKNLWDNLVHQWNSRK
jgi:hypothetical protein